MTTQAKPVPAALLADGNHDPSSELDRGLEYDVSTLLNRRSAAFGLLGGIGLLGLAACGTSTESGATGTTSASTTSSTTSATSSASSSSTASATASTVNTVVPNETGGPYPGDGSNGKNVLDDSGIIRSDIRSSFGTSTTTAEGIPMTVNLTVTDSTKGYAAISGAAVYLWHCNRAGEYSMYSQGVEQENYLRGVQATNDAGTATFTSIFPAAYSGRWPHIHFEVYKSTDDATSSGQIVKTSQIALPEAACKVVYATSGYEASVRNLAGTSLTSDNVFGDDGGIHQLATVTGSADEGYVVNLTIGV